MGVTIARPEAEVNCLRILTYDRCTSFQQHLRALGAGRAVEASREKATSSEVLRASRIMGRPPRPSSTRRPLRRGPYAAPAALVVLSQLQVVALPMHPDVPDLGPRVQPLAEGVEGAVLGSRAGGGRGRTL